MDKKTVNQLGSRMNDSVASKPSDFAMKMMAKMGWKEGQGLGKNADGIQQHISIKKRDENVGLGLENAKAAEAVADNWWHNTFSTNLAAFKTGLPGRKKDKKRDKKEKKKDKKDRHSNAEIDRVDEHSPPPSYEELFKATGGKRLGMRARMEQKGKILRTEQLEKDIFNTNVVSPSHTPIIGDSKRNGDRSESQTSLHPKENPNAGDGKREKKEKKNKLDRSSKEKRRKESSSSIDEEMKSPKQKKQKK